MKNLHSNVPHHIGPCRPTWVNRNQVCNMIDGGVSGFFKLVRLRYGMWWRYGPEFHGIVKKGEVYHTYIKPPRSEL